MSLSKKTMNEIKYFIFRNNTVEPFFGTADTEYSGYDDISYIPDAGNYVWFYQVPFKCGTESLSAEIDGYMDRLRLVVQKIPEKCPFIIITLVNMYPVKFTDNDLCLDDAISRFNRSCWDLGKEYGNIRVVDFSEFTSHYEKDRLVDWKYYFISQTPLNPRLAGDFRQWFTRRISSIELKRKKCIVLDLDNTLWGGVLGEDGMDGVKIGGDYPGKAFSFFQQGLLELSKTGIILTVCSKNNESDVWDMLEKNPYMILGKEHISAYRINWNNKADNIRELASELNIGTDSMVFIDDNPTERELVRQLLPDVEVPDFPERPYGLPAFFKDLVDRYFRVYSITDEDRNKASQYRANAARAMEQRRFSDFTDYLRSLEIHIRMYSADRFNLPRIAQMTQKTNQFNLTTRRYTESDLRGFLDSGWIIYCIGVSDRFGDNGITGAIMLRPAEYGFDIDSLLLSCRILGKGIEDVFVRYVINTLYRNDVGNITASYIPTRKNMQTADFYERMGFEVTENLPDGGKKYRLKPEHEYEIEDYYKFD